VFRFPRRIANYVTVGSHVKNTTGGSGSRSTGLQGMGSSAGSKGKSSRRGNRGGGGHTVVQGPGFGTGHDLNGLMPGLNFRINM
jgi:hypothetical protein